MSLLSCKKEPIVIPPSQQIRLTVLCQSCSAVYDGKTYKMKGSWNKTVPKPAPTELTIYTDYNQDLYASLDAGEDGYISVTTIINGKQKIQL